MIDRKKTTPIGYVVMALLLWMTHFKSPFASSLSIDSGYTYVFSSNTAWTKYSSNDLNHSLSTGTISGSYTLVLNGGTLKVSNTFTFSNKFTVINNSTIDLNNFLLTLSGNMGGNNSAHLTITDTSTPKIGKLYLSGTNTNIPSTYVTNSASIKISGTHSGTLYLGVGTLIANSGTNTLSNPIVLTNTAYINIPTISDKLILSSGISGAYNLYVTGSGTLELANGSNNSTSAIINVGNGSKLISDNAQDITEATEIILSGTYDIDGDPQTLYNLSGSGIITSGSGTGALTIGLTTDSTFNGLLSSAITNLTLTSTNTVQHTLTMTGVTNSITGTTTIGGYCTYYGKLSSSKPLAINTNGVMKFSSATTVSTLTNNGSMDLNARTVTLLNSTSTIGTVTDSSAGGIITLNGSTGIFNQDYSRPLTCTGTSTVKAGASKTISGAVTLSSNTILDSAGYTLLISGAISGAYMLYIMDSTATNGIISVSNASNASISSTVLSSGIFLLSTTSHPGSFFFNGGILRAGSTLSTISNLVSATADNSGIDLNGRNVTLTNAITNGSSYSFIISDSAVSKGSLILGANNTIKGLTNNGTVNLNGKILTLVGTSILGTITGSTGSVVVNNCITTASVNCARDLSVTNGGKLRASGSLTFGNITLG